MIAPSYGPYRVVIVDDERIARVGLRTVPSRYEQLRVVGEARHGDEAVAAIRVLRPDIVFLDIQMPERDGFGVLRELAAFRRHCACVFVTAHATHALQAYEVDAADYLHKPFSDARLTRSVQRAVRFLRGTRARSASTHVERLLLRTTEGTIFVDIADIARISVEGNYLRFFVGRSEYLARRTLAETSRELNNAGFLRISRSDLVNIARARAIHRRAGGRQRIRAGSRIGDVEPPVSARHSSCVREHLGTSGICGGVFGANSCPDDSHGRSVLHADITIAASESCPLGGPSW